MAMARLIYKKLYENEHFLEQDLFTRFLWIGLFTFTNDFGCLKGNSTYIARSIFGDKNMKKEVEVSLQKLEKIGFFEYYFYENEPYIFVKTFKRHQKISPSRLQKRFFIPLHPQVIADYKEHLSKHGYNILFPDTKCMQNVCKVPTKCIQEAYKMPTKGVHKARLIEYESNTSMNSNANSNANANLSFSNENESSVCTDKICSNFASLPEKQKAYLKKVQLLFYELFGKTFHWDTPCIYSRTNKKGKLIWEQTVVWRAVKHLITEAPEWNKGKWKNMLEALAKSEFYRETFKNFSFLHFLKRIYGSKQGKESITGVAMSYLSEVEKQWSTQWDKDIWDRLKKEGYLKDKKTQNYIDKMLRTALASGDWKTKTYKDFIKLAKERQE